MPTILPRKRYYAVLLSIVLAGFAGAASAEDLPSYMAPIGGRTTSSAAETAAKDVLALNTMMFQLYGTSGAIFRKNLMDNHPIILGLFSGAGGRFILYRPGQPPLEAPSVPIKYQLMKSVGHSTMALSEVVMPYLDNASDTSWRGSSLAYRSQMKSALDDLNKADVLGDWQENSRLILQNNVAFMDECAKAGVITVAAAQDGVDWITKFPRTDVHVAAWPDGKKVAVSFALFVEEFGFGQGPVYRPDLASRTPDLVNENFRQYSLSWGNLRVARLLVEPERLRQCRHHAGHGRRRPHLYDRRDGFRHRLAAQHAGRAARSSALSGGHCRHGAEPGAHEVAARDRGAVARSSSPRKRAPTPRAKPPPW